MSIDSDISALFDQFKLTDAELVIEVTKASFTKALMDRGYKRSHAAREWKIFCKLPYNERHDYIISLF